MNKRLSILTLLSACLSLQAQQTWTLRQCIEHAIDHNIAIQQGANQVEQTKVAVNTAKWARLPNLNGMPDKAGTGDAHKQPSRTKIQATILPSM